jgi:LPS export ABC transporter protein LptC
LKNKLIYFIILLHLFCSNQVQEENSNFSEDIYDNEIWNPTIVLSRESKKIVIAKSKKMYKQTNEKALLVGEVEADFFNEAGDHMSILYSDSARINEKSNNLHANGSVFVVSDSGYTLRTEQILWDNRYRMIIADDSVMFTTSDGDTLYGVGFESDMDLDHWRISKPFGIARDGI